jgi:hypothetical protein
MAVPDTPNTSVATLASLNAGTLQHAKDAIAAVGAGLDQRAAEAHEVAQRAQAAIGHKARPDQTERQQLGQPLGVLHVSLAPRHVRDPRGDADLAHMGADRVALPGALLDQQLARPMHHQRRLLLDRYKTRVGDCRQPGQGFEFLGYRFEAGRLK